MHTPFALHHTHTLGNPSRPTHAPSRCYTSPHPPLPTLRPPLLPHCLVHGPVHAFTSSQAAPHAVRCRSAAHEQRRRPAHPLFFLQSAQLQQPVTFYFLSCTLAIRLITPCLGSEAFVPFMRLAARVKTGNPFLPVAARPRSPCAACAVLCKQCTPCAFIPPAPLFLWHCPHFCKSHRGSHGEPGNTGAAAAPLL